MEAKKMVPWGEGQAGEGKRNTKRRWVAERLERVALTNEQKERLLLLGRQ